MSADTPPCGKRIRFPAEIVLIGSSRGLRPSRAHPEAEGTDSPQHLFFSDSAEILWISGRGICKEAIFSPGGPSPRSEKISTRGDQPKSSISLGRSRSACLPFGQATFPPRRSPASIGSREGSHPLALSRGLFWWRFWFPTKQACSFVDVVSDDTGRGALRSPTPLGGRVREGCAPSRALLGGRRTEFFLDGQGRFCSLAIFYCCSGEGFCFRRRGGGARCSPTSPRVTGCERAARPLALSAVGDERRFFV